MPATYRKRGASSEDYKRRSWMPEPPPPPKPRQWFILDMEVDYETYREFMYGREYRIDGDITKDILCSIGTLERYATEEHANEYPIEAANARKILDQIREEITVIINRKEDKKMKDHRNAADFIAALNDIYTESRATYDALYGAVEKAKAKMDRANEELRAPDCKNRELAQAKYDIARGEHRVAEDELRNEYRKMIAGHDQKVSDLREQFADYLDEHYSASPDKLDTATMQLLNTGICKPTELARLAERHSDNPTMLRIIGNFARNMRDEQKKHLTHDEEVICTNVANAGYQAKDGSRELALFDSAVSSAAYGLGKEYVHATRMHSLVSGWMDDFKNQIMNMSWKPAETAGAAGTGDASGGDE